MLKPTQSVLAAAASTDLLEYYETEASTVIVPQSEHGASFTHNNFDKGTSIIQVDRDTDAYESLLNEYKVTVNRTDAPTDVYSNYFDLYSSVTDRVLSISEDTTWREAVDDACAIRDSIGELFYGMLLISGDVIINPFHPLGALELIEDLGRDKPLFKDTSFKALLYVYKEAEVESLHTQYKTDMSSNSHVEHNISAIIELYTNRVVQEEDIPQPNVLVLDSSFVDEKMNTVWPTATVKYVSDQVEDDELAEYFLVAHQCMTAGVVAPYYGTSLLKTTNNNTVGDHLSPFLSCNINLSSARKKGTDYKSAYTTSPIVTFTSVCTGSLDKRTQVGVQSLNHANFNSPYNKRTIQHGALAYASRCIDTCFAIYRLNNIVTKEEDNEITDNNSDETESVDTGEETNDD